MNTPVLEMKNITKEFPGVKALNNVSFQVAEGEIHCLVGENGAGKSTLMKVLSGVYPHGEYTGDIIFSGKVQNFRGISDSEKAGIAIIYQELALVPEMTVYENIFLGHEIKSGILINWNETIKRAGEMLKMVRLDINLAAKVKELGIGKRQLVEIAKALSKDVKLLILDEPTAALNEDDSENLLNLLRDLKSHGVTCVLISHKLKEVIEIADSVTVLRDGQTICTLEAKKGEVSENALIKHMVGREIDNIYPKKENRQIGEIVLNVENWNAYDPALGRSILKDINFFVKKGYIFKTYEGRLIQDGFKSTAPGALQSNEFEFSVTNDSVAAILERNSGKVVELRYKEYLHSLPWRGKSNYVVIEVLRTQEGQKNNQLPYQ